MAKVAFYKAWKGDWTDWLIALWTWGKYSHVELVLENGKGFTASGREDRVRIKEIDFDDGRWEIIEIDKEVDFVLLESLLGHKYDKLGILFNEFLHIPVNGPQRYYCSEVVSCVLHSEPCAVDPWKLYKRLTGGKGKSLGLK